MTGGYRLPARHVIHTVGPVWRGGDDDEDRLLAACYHSSLGLAAGHGLATIAFPAISTGIYGFPAERAATIAVGDGRAGNRNGAWRVERRWCSAASTSTAADFTGGTRPLGGGRRDAARPPCHCRTSWSRRSLRTA